MAIFDDGKITGDALCFYIDGHALACELSCDIQVTQDMKAVSPYLAAGWQHNIPGIRSWQMSCAANFLTHFKEADYKVILQAMLDGRPMQVAMRTATDYAPSFILSGQAYASTTTLSSSGNDLVGYTAAFTGNGPLAMSSEAAEGDYWRILNANPAEDDKPLHIISDL